MHYREKYELLLKEIGTSREKAIKAHCFQCSGYNYRIARECKNHNCALYILKQNKLKKKEVEK
jgi:hypothetical protein